MASHAIEAQEPARSATLLALLFDHALKLYRARHFKRAVVLLESLLCDRPDDLDLLKIYGSCLQLCGAKREATTVYWRVLTLAPDEVDVLTNLGEVLLAGLDYQGASLVLGRAIALDPDYENPSAQRARALVATVVCAPR